MSTVPQTTCSAQHPLVFDAALRDARLQLPATADQARADRGLVLALNGAVSLESDTIALVRSGSDAEVVYRVHSRGGCDCPDSTRRRAQQPRLVGRGRPALADARDAAPGQTACKHHLAAILIALATLNLACKGYQPEALGEEWYPAVSLTEQWYGFSGSATEVESGLWWFCFANEHGGFYCSTSDLELWNREPEHHIAWRETVRSWDRWLASR